MSTSLGKYYDQVALGRVFIGSTAAAGVALPVETGTAVTFAVWNTATKKVAVPLWIGIGYVSGTITVGGFVMSNFNVGFNIATGAAMTAFTAGTPKNALLGSGLASIMSFTPSTATLAAGGTRCYGPISAHEIATAGPGVSTISHDFDGRLVVMPGQILFPSYSIAQTGVFSISMAWAEVDL